MMMDGGWGNEAWWVMGIGMVVLWGALVAGIVLLARAVGGPGRSGARALLDDRYARGEIDDDEYRRRQTNMRA